jgi:hypothetical protein
MLEEDLARNGASHGEHYDTEEKERHSFSSTRAADLPTKKNTERYQQNADLAPRRNCLS